MSQRSRRLSASVAGTFVVLASLGATPAVAATGTPRDLGHVSALVIDDRGRVLTTTTFDGQSLDGLEPTSVNNKGEVLGTLDGKPAVWRNGEIVTINPPTAAVGPFAAGGISDKGAVLLLDTGTPSTGGYVWKRGRSTHLTGGAPSVMNTAGQVFGYVYSGGGRFGGLDGVIWQRGEVSPTGGFGGYQTQILALGRNGGVSATSHHADIWCGDGLYDGAFTTPWLHAPDPGEPMFPPGEYLYEPHVVNAYGENAGPVGHQVFAPRPGVPEDVCPAGFTDIGTGVALRDGQWLVDFSPSAISDRGLVVGNRTLPDGRSEAVVFDHGRTSVLPPLASGDATVASAVNKQGEVLGTSRDHTVVWTYRRG